MDANDFAFIEFRLNVVLPTIFKDFMRQFPNDREHYVDCTVTALQSNAELFVITQLEHFLNDRGTDYYELQPELRERRFMYIGGDGSGNFYCMAGDNAESNELWLWEHDPYNGLSLCDGETLRDYFQFPREWELLTQPDPFATVPSDGIVISRADHPRRSILAPISMNQWHEYVIAHPQLELDEYFMAVSPFTKETVPLRRWPGRAKLIVEDSSAYIEYANGRLTLRAGPQAPPAQSMIINTIAADLHA